jgi:hypothetical protein
VERHDCYIPHDMHPYIFEVQGKLCAASQTLIAASAERLSFEDIETRLEGVRQRLSTMAPQEVRTLPDRTQAPANARVRYPAITT